MKKGLQDNVSQGDYKGGKTRGVVRCANTPYTLLYTTLILTLLALLVACQSETQKFVPDKDSLLRVSFEYLNGWRMHDWGQEESAGLYTLFPINHSIHNIVNRVLIKYDNLIWIAIYISNEVEADMQRLAELFTQPEEGLKIISDKSVSINGLEGREIITSFTKEAWNIVSINVLLADEDRYYQFKLLVIENQRGGIYERQFNKILETISPVD